MRRTVLGFALALTVAVGTLVPVRTAATGWYVVTFSGQAVAGPFTLLGDCTDMAKIMANKYSNISTVCQSK